MLLSLICLLTLKQACTYLTLQIYWNCFRSTLNLGRVIWIISDVTQHEKYAKTEQDFLLSHTTIPSLEAFASSILEYNQPLFHYEGWRNWSDQLRHTSFSATHPPCVNHHGKTLSTTWSLSLTFQCWDVRQNYVTKEHSRTKAVVMTWIYIYYIPFCDRYLFVPDQENLGTLKSTVT